MRSETYEKVTQMHRYTLKILPTQAWSRLRRLARGVLVLFEERCQLRRNKGENESSKARRARRGGERQRKRLDVLVVEHGGRHVVKNARFRGYSAFPPYSMGTQSQYSNDWMVRMQLSPGSEEHIQRRRD